jgi:hypothetical protein
MAARDFPIRTDLSKIGIPERSIRVLEKAAQIVQIVNDAAALQTTVNDITAEQEDQNLSLDSLDARLDIVEAFTNTDARYVRQDQTSAWSAATGTEARTALASYAGQTVSNPPTQAQVQTLDDAVKALSQHVVALINDLRSNGAIHE